MYNFNNNTPLRSQSRQLPDVISIEISQPDLLSTEITFQIPNYFQITFKLIWNYLVQKIPLPALPRSRFVIERLAVEPNLLIWFKKYRSPLSTLSPSPAGQWWKSENFGRIWQFLWRRQLYDDDKILMMMMLWWWSSIFVFLIFSNHHHHHICSPSASADDDNHDFQTNSFPTFLRFQKSVLGLQKKENHQNLILEMMES